MAVARLDAIIGAKTEKFDAGMTRARKSLFGFSKTGDMANKMLLGLGSTLLAGVGIYKFTAALGQAAERLDEIAKMSDRLGIASEKLAGLTLAASQTGASARDLSVGMRDMVRRISEAATGSGEAAGALRELGLSAAEMNKLAPDEQFAKLATAMKGVTNQGDKVRLAYEIMGRSGTKLVNTLSLGADGLAAMQSEAERLGMAFSREELAKVEAYNDAMDKLGKAFQAASGEILINIAPAATTAVELLADAVAYLRGSGVKPGKVEGGEGFKRSSLNKYNPLSYLQEAVRDKAFNDRLDPMAGQLTAAEARQRSARMRNAARDSAQEEKQLGFNKRFGDVFAAIGKRAGGLSNDSKIGETLAAGMVKGFAKMRDARREGAWGGMDLAAVARVEAMVGGHLAGQRDMGVADAAGERGQLRLAERGSREAFETINRARRSKEGDTQEQMLDVEKQQLEALNKIDGNLNTPTFNMITATA